MILPLLNIRGEQAAQGNAGSHIEALQYLANIIQVYRPMTPCGNSRRKSQPIGALELLLAATPINSCQRQEKQRSGRSGDTTGTTQTQNASGVSASASPIGAFHPRKLTQYSMPPIFCKLVPSSADAIIIYQ
jgi:hypothetical protein